MLTNEIILMIKVALDLVATLYILGIVQKFFPLHEKIIERVKELEIKLHTGIYSGLALYAFIKGCRILYQFHAIK